ncbi:MAG TPA: hypothetical protein PKE03_08775 [Bacteroidales bacterium]|nr:hypothetical protein [Bacteroidales bacterium]
MLKNNDIDLLRPWEDAGLDKLVRYANNPRVAAYLTDQFPHPYT